MKYSEETWTLKNRFPQRATSKRDTPYLKRAYYALRAGISALVHWAGGVTASAIILSILIFIVVNFYIYSSIVNLNSFFYSFLLLSVLTDGLYVLIHLPRKRVKYQKTHFDPTKLTILIACYNGENVIAETIDQAMRHVPAEQILVVSDASTDKTVSIARKKGVRVIENAKNMQKAFSVSIGMRVVKTPYVLLLDDDTLLGDIVIPTNLLDEGYSAVAFNVLPQKENSLINDLQIFEYQQSMELGKNVRAQAGAIGNISGAIGLYRTADLIKQTKLHSGQFAGEDEQRTLLVHLNSDRKGITYVNETVLTKVPATYQQLFRQRAYSWSASVPELFTLYWKILLSPRHHFLLKAEKAYQLYIYLTDPLRILFFWALFTKSSHLLLIYSFYLFLDGIVWLKLNRKTSLRSVIFFPVYTLGLTVCRFVGYFYWLVTKARYLSKKLHRYAEQRYLLYEYGLVFIVIILSWTISSGHFLSDLNLLHKISTNHLEDTATAFNYDGVPAYGTVPAPAVSPTPVNASYILVPVERGDTQRAIAYKAVIQYLEQNGDIAALHKDHAAAYSQLSTKIEAFDSTAPGFAVRVEKSDIQQALNNEGG